MDRRELKMRAKPRESTVVCKKCGAPLGFADMRCSNCGASARSEDHRFKPELRTGDIQRGPRTHVGSAPAEPQSDFGKGTVNLLGLILPLVGLICGALIGFGVANSTNKGSFGVVVGIVSAAALVCLSVVVEQILKNLSKMAENTERTMLAMEFQNEKINEFLDAYNEDNQINDENAAVFAGMLNKLIKLNGGQVDEEEVPQSVPQPKPQPVVEIKSETKSETMEEKKEEKRVAPDDFFNDEKEEVVEPERVAEPVTDEEDEDIFEPEFAEPAAEETEPEDVQTEEQEDEDEVVVLNCPHCDAELERTLSQLSGGVASCDVCGGMFKVEISDDDDEEYDDDNDDGFFD